MTTTVRHAPELHRALLTLADDCQYLSGPRIDGRATRWVGCSTCDAVCAVSPVPWGDGDRAWPISVICEDCASPCEHPDCGLARYEHRDGCEPQPPNVQVANVSNTR